MLERNVLRDVDRAKPHMALGVGKSPGIIFNDIHTHNMDSNTSKVV